MGRRTLGPAPLVPKFTWGISAKLPIPITRFGMAQFADGRSLIMGGTNPTLLENLGDVTATSLLFSANGSVVTTVGNLPTAQNQMVATRLGDGRILAVSGDGLLSTAQTIDSGLTWTARPAQVFPALAPALVTLANGNALRIGGATTSVEEYIQGSNTWATRAVLPAAMQQLQAILLPNGEVFASQFGGPQRVYLPGSDAWVTPTNSPSANNNCLTQVMLPSGKLFTCGSVGLLGADIYDPIGRTFSALPAYQTFHSSGIAIEHPNGFYLGEGLVVVFSGQGPPRAAFFDFRHNRWYGGGFEFPIPDAFSESMWREGVVHLGQYDFLALGGGFDDVPVPHILSRYAEVSTLKMNDGHVPSPPGSVSIVHGTDNNRIFVTWTPASDTKTATQDINYYVYTSPVAFGQSYAFADTDTEIWAGSLSREVTGFTSPNVPTFVVVRARNIYTQETVGNFETNTTQFTFTPPAFVPAPTFSWTPTVAMSEPRMGLMGSRRTDGRYHVFGGYNDVGSTISPGGDIYSETGLLRDGSPNGPAIAEGVALDAESILNNGSPVGHHRPTVVGGLPFNQIAASKNYPYTDLWFNTNSAVDRGTNPHPAREPVQYHAAVALPFGNILRIGGTILGLAVDVTNTVEQMYYQSRQLFYEGQTGAFTIGAVVSGNFYGGVATILDDWPGGYEILTYKGLTTAFTVGQTVTGASTNATGVILRILNSGTGGTLHLTGVTTTFQSDEVLTDGLGGAAVVHEQNLSATHDSLYVRIQSEGVFGSNQFGFAEPITDSFTGAATLVDSFGGGTATQLFQRWDFVAPMNVARWQHSAILMIDGRVLVVGGLDAIGNPIQSAEVYDVATNVWTLIPNVITLKYTGQVGTFSVGEIIIGQTTAATATIVVDVNAGSTGTLVINTITGVFLSGEEIIGDVTGDAFAFGTQMDSIRPRNATFPLVVLQDGRVMAINGNSGQNDLFTPGSDTFAPAADNAPGRGEFTAHVFGDGTVGTFGGRVAGIATSDVRLYFPGGDSWSTVASMGTPRCRHVSFLLPNNKVLVVGGEDAAGSPLASAEISS